MACLNWFSGTLAPRYGFFVWPFCLVGIFFTISGAGLIHYFIRKRQHNPRVLVPQLPWVLHHPSRIRALKLILYVGFLISAVPAIEAIPKITNVYHIDILRWSFCAAGCVVLTLFLWFRNIDYAREHFFRGLERKIILQNLSANEISMIFIREFLGQTLREWLTEFHNKRHRLEEEARTALLKAVSELDGLGKLDPNMRYELTGRINEIRNRVSVPIGNLTNHLDQYLAQLRDLVNKRFYPDEVHVLIDEVESALNKVKETHKDFDRQVDGEIERRLKEG